MEKFNAYRKPLAIASVISILLGGAGCSAKENYDTNVQCVSFNMGPHWASRVASVAALKLAGVDVNKLKGGLTDSLSVEIEDLEQLHQEPYADGGLPNSLDVVSLCIDEEKNLITPGPYTMAIDDISEKSKLPKYDIVVTYKTGAKPNAFDWPTNK